ncbi:MAG: hypothetical protein ACFFEV_06955 [Candidatus Thorarchaeota archaeon]
MGNDDLPRIRVLVNTSKLLRCNWCGTFQSDTWISNKKGVYCSSNCVKAEGYQDRCFCICFLVITIGLSGAFTRVVIPERNATIFVIIGIASFLILVYAIFDTKSVSDYIGEVPKNARVAKSSGDVIFLKTVASHIECPNCDGNIDLSNIQEDMVYHCDYCGADGIIELVQIQED